MNNINRDQFEAWAMTERGGNIAHHFESDERYASATVQGWWLAWQAAFEAGRLQGRGEASGQAMDEPHPQDLCRELREALGMFAGAMPISPKQAWDEAIAKVQALSTDAARIDWLESWSKYHGLTAEDQDELFELIFWHHTQDNRKHFTLRDALDAARGVT